MREQDLIRAVWTGQSFIPDGNYAMAQVCDRLGEGQVVSLDLDPDRSGKSHKHQFAFVRTAWMNLPEQLAGMPYAATSESLRKHALIVTGHCNTQMIACGDAGRALRMKAVLSTVATQLNGYAITEVSGPVVYCHTPHSQSMKAMGGEAFQQSKKDILEWMADLIGVTPNELADMGKKGTA